jgi:electron transfer flavoprotein beta subunit
MNIVVVVKQVPDLAEELEVNDDGNALDEDCLSWVLNEFDDHALEEALHLKEETGGTVTVLAPGFEGVEAVLFTCLAKGAARSVKVGDFEENPDSHTIARAMAKALSEIPHDVVLTGVQSISDLDGQVGPLLAGALGIPHVSVVTHISLDSGSNSATVNQEYAGGVLAEFEVTLPAVLGIQAAREVPRYAPVSRVRQLMKTETIDEVAVDVESGSGLVVKKLAPPEAAGHAEMIEGDEDEVSERLVAILGDAGLLNK